jgi:hypothetical protein
MVQVRPTQLRRRRRYSITSPAGMAVIACFFTAASIYFSMKLKQPTTIEPPAAGEEDDEDDDDDKITSTWTPPPDEVHKPPKLAMLLSFPNSGTSYTLKLVKTATGYFTGNTYIKELYEKRDLIFPESGKGPFWQDETKDVRQTMRRPPEYVLVKSHCAGYCSTCSPIDTMTSEREFSNGCTKTFDVHDEVARFDVEKISKIVHMVRNPMDNVVARYHLDMHMRAKYDKVSEYDDNTSEGFIKSCATFVDAWWKNDENREEAISLLPQPAQDALTLWHDAHVPCFSDFYRYVEWHNHAFELRNQLKVPQMVLHYESWGTDWESSKWRLLTFLEYDKIVKDPILETIPFVSSGKSYAHFYTDKQREALLKGFKLLASRETWEVIQDYFR